MKNSELEKLEKLLTEAEEEIRSAQADWQMAKRSHYKAWDREYEFAGDEKRVKESVKWQRSAENAFHEAEAKKLKAEDKAIVIKEKINILKKDLF